LDRISLSKNPTYLKQFLHEHHLSGITPVISKRGKAELRYVLYQAAMIASTRNTHFIAYYTKRLRGREKERGIKTKMRVR